MSTEKGFKILDHTADEYILAFGPSLEEAFASAALAMSEVMTDTRLVEPKEAEPVEVEADDEKGLLYSWLEALLIKFDAEGKLFSRFDVKKIERTGTGVRLEATVWGEPFDPEKHPSRTGVKAITYHQMEISQKNNHVEVRFLLDI